MQQHDDVVTDRVGVRVMSRARIPTEHCVFQLYLYRSDSDGAEHLALVRGEVRGHEGVLTRLHSECFTGDLMGSLRCDCGPQLHAAMRTIGQAERGVLLYLRQEGRGIGLLNKLRAYELQDIGYDTVDANLMLGLAADAREYRTAALILHDLGVRSVDLITNNPRKIEDLVNSRIRVRRRIPLEVPPNAENLAYLSTKARRMDHMLSGVGSEIGGQGSGIGVATTLPVIPDFSDGTETDVPASAVPIHDRPLTPDPIESWLGTLPRRPHRPLVTLCFAQSLDGSIARECGKQLLLSGRESLCLTHRLRAWHDAILVGIGTVLSDDPRLTVRLLSGPSPRPVVVDSSLRVPLTARILEHPQPPWIVTGPQHDTVKRGALEQRGATVTEVATSPDGGLDLLALLRLLHERGVRHLMVEGGARVLNAFLRLRLADAAIVTVAPTWIGGVQGIKQTDVPMPKLQQPLWLHAGSDMVMCAALDWQDLPTL